ncbi:uncharacterized protein LRP34_004933 isoform 2-T2 [Phaethornis superciliosus]
MPPLPRRSASASAERAFPSSRCSRGPGPGGASPGSGAESPECPRPAGGSPAPPPAEPWAFQSQVAAARCARSPWSRRSWERRERWSSAGWFQSPWADGTNIKKPINCLAPKAMDSLLTWVQDQLDEQTLCPAKAVREELQSRGKVLPGPVVLCNQLCSSGAVEPSVPGAGFLEKKSQEKRK